MSIIPLLKLRNTLRLIRHGNLPSHLEALMDLQVQARARKVAGISHLEPDVSSSMYRRLREGKSRALAELEVSLGGQGDTRSNFGMTSDLMVDSFYEELARQQSTDVLDILREIALHA